MDVTLPSGEVLTDIPEGTTKAQIIAKLQANGRDVSGLVGPSETSSNGPSPLDQTSGPVLDTIKTLGSGMVGGVAGGIAGLGALGIGAAGKALGLTDRNPSDIAGDTVRAVQDKLTLAPSTPGGAALTNTISAPFDWLAKKADQAGGWVTDKTGSPALGAATNTALQAAPQLVLEGAKVMPRIRPFASDPVALESASRLAANGIDVTPAQASGNTTLKMVNAALDKLPVSSGMQTKVRTAQTAQVNKALANTFGSDAESLTPEALTKARDALGRGFDDVTSRSTITPDAVNKLSDQLANVTDNVNRYVGDSGAQKVILNTIDDILAKVGEDGTMPGAAYKSLDSSIGKRANTASNSDVKTSLGSIREALRDSMDASVSPADSAQWTDLRQKYSNLMKIAPAVDSAGDVSVPKVLQNIKTQNRSSVFTGGGDLGQLARDVKNTIGTTVPDSGTAQRAWYANAMTGGLSGAAVLHPGALAGLGIPPLVQKIVNSRAMGRVATEGINPGGALSAADRARILLLMQQAKTQ